MAKHAQQREMERERKSNFLKSIINIINNTNYIKQ